MEDTDNIGKVITFYSYKGGTGRTMALANIACLLAQQQEKLAKKIGVKRTQPKDVLMIDWDLEAPGLHRYFAKYMKHSFPYSYDNQTSLEEHSGLIDFFYELEQEINKKFSEGSGISQYNIYSILQEIKFEKYLIEIKDIPFLYLLKSGNFKDNYKGRIRRFNWEKLFDRSGEVFSAFAEFLAQRFSYILIDSRTGITDISNICTTLMPEKLVTVFTSNTQSITGLRDLIRQATKYRQYYSNDVRSLVVFPLPSRIDITEPDLKEIWRDGDRKQRIKGYKPTFEKLFSEIYHQPCDLKKYFDEVQIQHVPRYAYGEEIAVKIEESDDRLSLSKSYQKFRDFLVLDTPWSKKKSDTLLLSHSKTIWQLPSKLSNPSTSIHSSHFKYACFISYRSGDRQREKNYIFELTQQLREDLLNELALLLEPSVQDVCLDTSGLQVGDRLDLNITEALSQSVCMLCLWTPIYFSKTHPYCAREYYTMEILEKKRFELLGISGNEATEGLIIPLTLRLSRRFPRSINRLYINLENYLLPSGEGLQRDSEYYKTVQQIAEYITERYWELSQIPPEELKLCSEFALSQANDEEFQRWLNKMLE